MTIDLSPLSSRRVLSQNDVIAIGKKVVELIRDQTDRLQGVRIEQKIRAVTKVTGGRLLNTDDGDDVRITFKTRFGSGLDVTIDTNQLNDTTLRQVISNTTAIAPPQVDPEPEDLNDQLHATYRERSFPFVSLWHDSTIKAMETARGEVIPELIEQLHAAKLTGAATIGCAARSVLYLYSLGLTAFSQETDCEVTVTARGMDGSASGWSGQVNRDWTVLSPGKVAAEAIMLANRSRNPVAFEPGRRVTILGPAAVAQLVRTMDYAFGGRAAQSNSQSPFSVANEEAHGRHTKLGLRVFDPRIMMVSDPADPLGGYPPFFEAGGLEGLAHGFPTGSVTWIDHGVLKRLAYDIYDGLRHDLSPCDTPKSVRLSTVPGTQTATIDEMIANCREGIYVNRFSNVSLLERATGMMTGVTRDGCFFIKNGKIEKPIKNFRFTDSPFFAFNNVEMIGAPERVAFGYQAVPTLRERYATWRRWPPLPVIVPPMMIRDFNFTGLSEAV